MNTFIFEYNDIQCFVIYITKLYSGMMLTATYLTKSKTSLSFTIGSSDVFVVELVINIHWTEPILKILKSSHLRTFIYEDSMKFLIPSLKLVSTIFH